MLRDFSSLFAVQRQIFGICPHSNEFFRLSDCRLIIEGGKRDWLDNLHYAENKIEAAEDEVSKQERKMREKAREHGRSEARRLIRKVDPVFAPRKLCPQDAAPLFQPVDFLVFQGLSSENAVKSIHLLDQKSKQGEHRTIQRSIERCVEQGKFEWATLRVSNNGEITHEK